MMNESVVKWIEIFEADDGWHWHAKGGNGEVVAQGEAHTSRHDAERAAQGVFPNVPQRMQT